jgi:hypothetical protein
MSARRTTPATSDRSSTVAGIHKTVLAVLLRPREWRPQADRCVTHAFLCACIPNDKFRRRFFLDINMIRELCDRAEQCLAQDKCVWQHVLHPQCCPSENFSSFQQHRAASKCSGQDFWGPPRSIWGPHAPVFGVWEPVYSRRHRLHRLLVPWRLRRPRRIFSGNHRSSAGS